MGIVMSGLDYSKASIELREQLSFTKNGVIDMVSAVANSEGVSGAVLLSTCNRTELYISADSDLDPGRLLCGLAGADYAEFEDAFVTRSDEDALLHLMHVACGLESQILGEDQILTQVKTAAAIAREANASDAKLETLFRTASSCGKAVKSELRLTGLPTSAADSAVSALRAFFGELSGKSALVIGNGEMGRLSAQLLYEAGCRVTVTLRSYRHGTTLIPPGCEVCQYDNRYEFMGGVDMIISATTSPHYTVAARELKKVINPPQVMIDLAIPRDIDPDAGEYTILYNVDDLGQRTGVAPETAARVSEIVAEYMDRFLRWQNFRDCLPAIEELKEAVAERVRSHVDKESDPEEIAETAAIRAVELLTGGLAEGLTPERLKECAFGIRSRTR